MARTSILLTKAADASLMATDNRNTEGGDYPTRALRTIDNTETRTVFTNQWLNESGATPFVRTAPSGDINLMKLLL